MIALFSFAALCLAGIGYLFWFLTDSDRRVADDLSRAHGGHGSNGTEIDTEERIAS